MTAPGIYPGMSRAEYDGIDAVNWSSLRHMRRSPKRYRWRLDHPQPQTPAMLLGIAAHVATLEPERFASTYAVEPDWSEELGPRPRKPPALGPNPRPATVTRHESAMLAWADYQAPIVSWEVEHSGCERLTAGAHDRVERIAAEVHASPLARPYLDMPHREIAVVFERQGMLCKSRLDMLGEYIDELKTTRDIVERAFTRQAAQLDYHCQAAFQRSAVQHATGKLLPVVVIAVDNDDECDVAVYRYDDGALAYGDLIVKGLLERLAVCRATDTWPGIYDHERALTVPDYMMGDEGAVTLTLGGEDVADGSL